MIFSFLQPLIDFLLPKDNLTREIEEMAPDIFAQKAKRASLPHRASFEALFSYKDPLVRKVVWLIKYHRNYLAMKLAAQLLLERLAEEASEEILFSNGRKSLLIPIPMSKNRRRARGGNHMEKLARAIMEGGGEAFFELETEALTRARETPPQTSIKDARRRRENIAGAFSVTTPERITQRCILLLDDVATTGATLSEARRVLMETGAKKVKAVAFAH